MDSSLSISKSMSESLLTLSKSSAVVGSSWMLSSIIFTTYYSTAFLRHGKINQSQLSASTRKLGKPVLHENVTMQNKLRSIALLYTGPQQLTILRLSGSFLLGIFAHLELFMFQARLQKCLSVMKDFVWPAIFMFMANYFNVIALDRLGISLTYTSKCGIPILTVLITILTDGFDAIPSLLSLASLIPIAIGIAMASWNSPTFDLSGFISAAVSATSQALLNVSCKRALTKTKTSGLQAQTTMAALAFCIAIITTTVDAYKKHITKINGNKQRGDLNEFIQAIPPVSIAIGAVASYHIEYVLSFLFLSLVKPITYGTCDAIRRLGIIMSGRRIFGGAAFSMLNYSGIGLALFGALCYSITTNITKQ